VRGEKKGSEGKGERREVRRRGAHIKTLGYFGCWCGVKAGEGRGPTSRDFESAGYPSRRTVGELTRKLEREGS